MRRGCAMVDSWRCRCLRSARHPYHRVFMLAHLLHVPMGLPAMVALRRCVTRLATLRMVFSPSTVARDAASTHAPDRPVIMDVLHDGSAWERQDEQRGSFVGTVVLLVSSIDRIHGNQMSSSSPGWYFSKDSQVHGLPLSDLGVLGVLGASPWGPRQSGFSRAAVPTGCPEVETVEV